MGLHGLHRRTISGACVIRNPGGAAACPATPAFPDSWVWSRYGLAHASAVVGAAGSVATHHSCAPSGPSAAGAGDGPGALARWAAGPASAGLGM